MVSVMDVSCSERKIGYGMKPQYFSSTPRMRYSLENSCESSAMCSVTVVPTSVRVPSVISKSTPFLDSQCTGFAPGSWLSVSISTLSATMKVE